MTTPLKIALKYFELSNERNLNEIRNMLEEDATYHSDNTGIHQGKETIMTMLQTFYANFPKLKWEIHETATKSEETVEIVFTLYATDSTGKKMTKSGVETIIVQNSKIKHIKVRNSEPYKSKS